jgi:hypothetical protein
MPVTLRSVLAARDQSMRIATKSCGDRELRQVANRAGVPQFALHYREAKAARTRSEVMGVCLSLTPVSSGTHCSRREQRVA